MCGKFHKNSVFHPESGHYEEKTNKIFLRKCADIFIGTCSKNVNLNDSYMIHISQSSGD